MSYNIWFDNPENTENPWSERKNGIKETINQLKPEIFCVQEALDHQVKFLEFGEYKHFGVGRDDGKNAGEFSAILFDTIRFGFKNGGNFWLSETPDIAGSKGWDAECVRIATWIHLLDSKTGKLFFVFNTHFDHMGETARLESAGLIKQKIAEIAGDQPVILTGDFNCQRGSDPYQVITDEDFSKPLSDTRYVSDNLSSEPDYSFVGSEFKGSKGNIIDHIFVSQDIKVFKALIYENCQNGKCPSDHLPVVSEIIIE
ncbi:MAG: endonuclease/exonuclease/phosphatase family protein [Bacteroidales bacterium]|nr:endonuclease/exonuclease/phosphatase family protein [Bacteroidales bacterium]